MSTWHYEQDCQRLGPISIPEIETLIRANAINGQTLVWAPGLPEWVALSQTELRSCLVHSQVPPALPSTKISSVAVGVLCVAPLIGLMLEAMLAGAMASNEFTVKYEVAAALQSNKYWYVTLLLNVGLSLLDNNRLKKAGVNTDAFGKFAFIVPVYLWKRAKSLQRGMAFFWIWMVTFGLTLTV